MMKKWLVKAFLIGIVLLIPSFVLQVSADESKPVTNNFSAVLDKST